MYSVRLERDAKGRPIKGAKAYAAGGLKPKADQVTIGLSAERRALGYRSSLSVHVAPSTSSRRWEKRDQRRK